MLSDPFESVTQEEVQKFSTSPRHGKDVEMECPVSFNEIECNDAAQNNNLSEPSNKTINKSPLQQPKKPSNNISTEISKNNRQSKENSHRLLKLSLLNSTISPFRRARNSVSLEKSVFSEAGELAEKLSQLVTESPEEDSCDDLMAITPNWIDSETDVDSDLEIMYEMPILQETEKALEVSKLCEKNEADNGVDKPLLRQPVPLQILRRGAFVIDTLNRNIVSREKGNAKRATLSSPQHNPFRRGTFVIDTSKRNIESGEQDNVKIPAPHVNPSRRGTFVIHTSNRNIGPEKYNGGTTLTHDQPNCTKRPLLPTHKIRIPSIDKSTKPEIVPTKFKSSVLAPKTRLPLKALISSKKLNLKSSVPAASFSRRPSLTDINPPMKKLESVKETATGKAQVKTIKPPQDFVRNVSKMGALKFTKPSRRELILEKNKENKVPK